MIDSMNRLREVMASAVAETFEEMFFLEVLQVEFPEAPGPEPEVLKTSLLINDPFPGEMCLEAPRSSVADMARMLFNTDEEEIPEQTLLDLLAELLNTIAGRVMNRVIPPETSFRLGLPETRTEGFLGTEDEILECRFKVDDAIFSLAAGGEVFLSCLNPEGMPSQ
ncbi:MAG: chemotaxis protein CheX [Deltaproteobacteria bacterium]|nr:chemotaxis protein CheX [Deltaproteobacteria bacterium]MBW2016329.1 chemotaxis protein CheX [Deltaproteobacteria bacterium]